MSIIYVTVSVLFLTLEVISGCISLSVVEESVSIICVTVSMLFLMCGGDIWFDPPAVISDVWYLPFCV